jgi:acetamidase/formamidase
MTGGRFQFFVRKDMKLAWPRAETPTHWIVMGLNPNLEEAMKIAVRETINFITSRFPKLTREEAYMIASVAVDYHVTQVVDGTKGIHANSIPYTQKKIRRRVDKMQIGKSRWNTGSSAGIFTSGRRPLRQLSA